MRKRIAALLLPAVVGLGLAMGTAPAQASTYGSCTISGCSDAYTAEQTWNSLGDPTSRGWYDLPDGSCSFAGGQYYNNDGQLPSGDTYYEYDVYERSCGAHRDAYRIIHDISADTWYYSPDHYSDFYLM
ncbi:ribonuclease domain-containing protein [Amycolatopsis benzoatilytica]|uniref:ribonuclease domain-containing protein n=1 Tax=Amycolatopsis benzoatilytica TaxID=346045 RepID=UPI0003716E82|nr:ribonuclease domain-containing protein [Amycolatopsis benzoatilytica]